MKGVSPVEIAASCGSLHHADASTVMLLITALGLRQVLRVPPDSVARPFHTIDSEAQLKYTSIFNARWPTCRDELILLEK